MKNLTSKIVMAMFVTIIGIAGANAAVVQGDGGPGVASKAYVDRTDGTLSSLTTTVKTDLVGAINSLKSDVDTSVTNLGDTYATDAELANAISADNTTHDDVTYAVKATEGVAATNTTNIGTLGNLTTTAKDNLVNAINEVQDETNTNTTNISNLTTTVSNLDNDYVNNTELSTAISNEVTRADGKYEQVANKSTAASVETDTGSDTKYTTVAAVESLITASESDTATTITNIEGDITAIEGDITNIEGDITNLETTKQNLIGGGTAGTVITNTGTAGTVGSVTLTLLATAPVTCSDPASYCTLTTNGTELKWEVVTR